MAKSNRNDIISEYSLKISLYMIFIFCAFVSIVAWVFNWLCWYREWCCFNVCDDYSNRVFVWWLTFIFLCGILACCISGFVSANRLGFASYGVQCAYERIYYDIINGQIKDTYPKWEGFELLKSFSDNVQQIYDNDNLNFHLEDYYISKEEISCYEDLETKLMLPVYKQFANDICSLEKVEDKKSYAEDANLYFHHVINSIFDIKNYKSLELTMRNIDVSKLKQDMDYYKSNFAEEFEYYIHVIRGVGQIVPLIYFSLLLVVVVVAAFLLIVYYCNCIVYVTQNFYEIPMHIVWNLIRFFIFSFFMYGYAYGVIFLLAMDAIPFVKYLFGKENLESSSPSVISTESKGFFYKCLYQEKVRNSNDFCIDDFLKKIIQYKIWKEKNIDDISYQILLKYKENLLGALDLSRIDTKYFEKYQKIYENTGSIYSSYNCDFIQNYLNVLYDALWDLGTESRKLCAISCFIAFFGIFTVYGILWTMHLWKKSDTSDGYKYNGSGEMGGYGNEYKKLNDKKVILNSHQKKRKINKPFIPPPKVDDNNQDDFDDNNIEMQNQNNNQNDGSDDDD